MNRTAKEWAEQCRYPNKLADVFEQAMAQAREEALELAEHACHIDLPYRIAQLASARIRALKKGTE
jgi:hypothetical protein